MDIEHKIRARAIQLRAYEIWQYRQEYGMFFTLDRLGRPRAITAQDDWLEAEEELRV